jgi:hypothetical protein
MSIRNNLFALFFCLCVQPALADGIINGGSGGGSGTVTSISAGCGSSTGGSAITTNGFIAATEVVNLQTGSNYAVLGTDCGKLVDLSSSSAQTPTIAQAGTSTFTSGYYVDICNINTGLQTLTPTTSTINGGTTLAIPANKCYHVVSDGTNYQVAGIPASPLNRSGIFGTAGYLNVQPAGTDNDSGSSGTIANAYVNTWGARTFTSTSATTVTTPASNFFDVCAASTNVTFTNPCFAAIFSSAASGGMIGLSAPGNTSGWRSYAFVNGGGTTLKFQRWTDNFGTPTSAIFTFDNNITADTFHVTAGAMSIVGVTDATKTDATVCRDTTSGQLYFGSGTLGICLGTSSSIRFKHDWNTINNGLDTVKKLDPGTYRYNEGVADNGARLQYGFKAEDYAKALPVLTRFDAEGRPSGIDLVGLIPVLVSAIKQQQAEIEELKSKLK